MTVIIAYALFWIFFLGIAALALKIHDALQPLWLRQLKRFEAARKSMGERHG